MKYLVPVTFVFLLFTFSLFSQTGLRVNGTKIIIPSGAILWIDGGQNGDVTATTVSSADGRIDLNGTIKIEGDWVNNNTSADILINQNTDGTIEIAGTTAQNLSGTATNDFVFEKLKINSGAILILDYDQSLTLGGDFTQNGYFRINSTSLGTGSFLDNGTISQTGNSHIGRFVDGASGGINHFYSPSVSDATAIQLFSSSKGQYLINTFNYGTQSFDRVANNDLISASKGYVVAYSDTNTIYVKGSINYGTITQNISSSLDHWNLIGNPYPSSLDAVDFLTTNADGSTPSIYGILYLWDEGSVKDVNDYASWNSIGHARTNSGGTTPTRYFGTGQGFFVQSKSKIKNAVSFTNAMRELNNTQFFLPEPENLSRIKISVTNEDVGFNEVLLGFVEDATYGVDNLYDGHKLQGNPDLSFYSFIQGIDEKFVIQGLPLLDKNTTIPLGLEITKSGKYVFKKELLENFDEGIDVYFYDKLFEKEYDLNTIEEIVYQLDAGEIDNRFELRFILNQNEINEFEKSSNILNPIIYVKEKTLYIQNNRPITGYVKVVDMLGKELVVKNIENCLSETIEINEAKGYYLVYVKNSQIQVCQKVFVY